MEVGICVITCLRPAGINKLLSSLGQLTFTKVESPSITLYVVDNDPNGSAKAVCDQHSAVLNIHYSIEERRGIPFARNKGLSCLHEQIDYVVFVDDDEEVSPNWLDELLHAHQKYKADIVTGPVIPKFTGEVDDWVIRGKFFERARHATGRSLPFAATNNVLMRKEIIMSLNIRFDERFGKTGGSDTHFFMRVTKAGYKIMWVDEALVYEWIPASRANFKWLLQRSFRLGNTISLCEIDIQDTKTKLLRLFKGFGKIAGGVASVPLGMLKGKHTYVKALQSVYYGLGILAGFSGIRYKEYKKIHQV